jgi:muramidase (phage lysozyme)
MTPSPTLQKFLDLVAFSEGTSTHPLTVNRGYDVIVTGADGPEVFTDYSDHPFAHRKAKLIREGLHSTASGRYQLLYRWWSAYKPMLGLSDFSPPSQDAVALQQMKERGAIELVLEGDITGAIHACSNIWASFPGNDYGQGGHTMSTLRTYYSKL